MVGDNSSSKGSAGAALQSCPIFGRFPVGFSEGNPYAVLRVGVLRGTGSAVAVAFSAYGRGLLRPVLNGRVALVSAKPDDDLIASITPEVIASLHKAGFFEKLDDLLCPKIGSNPAEKCSGDFKISECLLRASDFSSDDLADIFGVLEAQGGCCDCEILYNVCESNRLKSTYWRDRVKDSGGQKRHTN